VEHSYFKESLIKGYVVFLTWCGVFCGVFCQKSKSPQVQITTSICGDLFEVGSKVRGHYENIKKMFDSMCTLYLECFYKE